jgi:broad specificity phosphatase PhoE
MSLTTVHLLRHGEVHNPEKVLYGRHTMARRAADALADHDVARVVASPLERAQQTAAPIAEQFGLGIDTEDRIIEASNVFEGKRVGVGDGVLRKPQYWHHLRDPFTPSWGEPYAELAARMTAAVEDARDATPALLARPSTAAVLVGIADVVHVRRRPAGRCALHRTIRRSAPRSQQGRRRLT